MACSATLTADDQRALLGELGMEQAEIIRGTFDRPNIYWGVDVLATGWDVRDRHLQAVLLTLPARSQAIVYATYTRTCERLAAGLARNGFRAAAYHGRLPGEQRQILEQRFSNGAEDLQILVATKAFGMGIDNHNVELVIHFNHPENLTEYYQQAGRAGRNSQPALALTLYDERDKEEHEFLRSRNPPDGEWLERILAAVPRVGKLFPEVELLGHRRGVTQPPDRRALARHLELLARLRFLVVREAADPTRLVRDWGLSEDLTADLGDDLTDSQRKRASSWADELRHSAQFPLPPTARATLADWIDTDTVLAYGAAHRWWRLLPASGRSFWLEWGASSREGLESALTRETQRPPADLERLRDWLTNDNNCRRQRLVHAFSPEEELLPSPRCCNVCQVETGNGHPWLQEGFLPFPRKELRPVEAEILSTLEDNCLSEKHLLGRLLRVSEGSHLGHRDRLPRYLEFLREGGWAVCEQGMWKLTLSGQECLDRGIYPAWDEPSQVPAPRAPAGSRDSQQHVSSAVAPPSAASEQKVNDFPCYLSLVEGQAARHRDWSSCKRRTDKKSLVKPPRKCSTLEEALAILAEWGLRQDLPPFWEASHEAGAASPSPVAESTVRWFPCRFLDNARRFLENAQFIPQPIKAPEVFRVKRKRTTAIGYSTGTIQLQNGQPDDLKEWEGLRAVEDAWLKAGLSSGVSGNPCWDADLFRYFHSVVLGNRLRGWTGEPIGPCLLVRDVGNYRPAGVLSPEGWRRQPGEADLTRLWDALTEVRWQSGSRWCCAHHQDPELNLVVVAFPITPAARFLAQAWDWSAAEVRSEDRARVSSRIQQELGICLVKRWAQSAWREESLRLGNQLDVLANWISSTILFRDERPWELKHSPGEVIMKPSGNEDWSRRLIDQRSGGRLLFRRPLLGEERDCQEMAHFLARTPRRTQP